MQRLKIQAKARWGKGQGQYSKLNTFAASVGRSNWTVFMPLAFHSIKEDNPDQCQGVKGQGQIYKIGYFRFNSASEGVKNISEHIRKHLTKHVGMCPNAFGKLHYLETRAG